MKTLRPCLFCGKDMGEGVYCRECDAEKCRKIIAAHAVLKEGAR